MLDIEMLDIEIIYSNRSPQGSPAGRFIKNWGKCGRKRKIRRSTQRDVTETPNKESGMHIIILNRL